MADPYTIRIYVPDGDPEGVRLIDRMNWTGRGIVFPRTKWNEVRQRSEWQRTGVYILVGYTGENPVLPTLYIGQGDVVQARIDDHVRNKDFWDRGMVFVSTAAGGLNRAHVAWLEYALVKRAKETEQYNLDNANVPQEPTMGEAERADTQGFLQEILQILPLVGLRALEFPKPVAVPAAITPEATPRRLPETLDTLVVPAYPEGFAEVFLGQDSWHAVCISGGMLDKIKYIAGYQGAPVSAVTHYAPVKSIEPYGEEGKYKLVFSEKAKPIGPIPFGNAPQGAMLGPRYTSFAKLERAKKLTDLFGRS